VYDKLQLGERIKDISIGWHIRMVAKGIMGKDVEELRNIKTAKQTIIELKKQIGELEDEIFILKNQIEYLTRPWYKKLYDFLWRPIW